MSAQNKLKCSLIAVFTLLPGAPELTHKYM